MSRHAALVWAVLLLAFTTLFVMRQSAQFSALGHALRNADRAWMAAALLVQLGVMAMAGVTYKVVLRRLRHELPWWRLVRMHLQRQVVGTVTPAGGPASIYVLVRSLGERGVSADDALLATSIRSVAGYSAFVSLLIPVLMLYQPSPLIMVGAGLLGGLLVLMTAVMVMLFRQPEGPAPRKRFVPERLHAFVERTRGHRIRPSDLLKPFGLMLAHNLAGATLLYFCLRAVGQHPSPTTALIGFVIGTLLVMVAPVFGGIGVVEVTIALVLGQLGVPSGAAVGAAVLFRVAELWLPLAVGLLIQAAGLPAAEPVTRRAGSLAGGLRAQYPREALLGLAGGGAILASLALGLDEIGITMTAVVALAVVAASLLPRLSRQGSRAAFATAAGTFALLPTFVVVYAGQSVDADALLHLVQRLA